jgi:hypothetical protein
MDLKPLICWLLHQSSREILLPGRLPNQMDAVVFCWRCDSFRGKAVKVFHPTDGLSRAS